MKLLRRPRGDERSLPTTLNPLVRRLYSARGVPAEQCDLTIDRLLSPDEMKGVFAAGEALADAVVSQKAICCCLDYDCDGSTAGALVISTLQALGAERVSGVVPDRITMGYGLTIPLVDLAISRGAEVLITVDAGITSFEGVAYARSKGLVVILTDHHLAADSLPDAHFIVNPNQPGCGFKSKSLAGVGVAFYTMSVTRRELARRGWFAHRSPPNLSHWLDLVAIGTIGDLQALDYNNRILVHCGIQRLREGRTRPGVRAILSAAGVDLAKAGSQDIGFRLAPRLNAAGRIADMGIGLKCLLAANDGEAETYAGQLDRINRDRQALQKTMVSEAVPAAQEQSHLMCISVFDESFHEGVVGLVASRIKEDWNRPAFAFAQAQEQGLLKGSGRSVPGVHIRDLLVRVQREIPDVLVRYGGHAAACGLLVRKDGLDAFREAAHRVASEHLSAADLEQQLLTDGELAPYEMTLENALAIERETAWGMGFPPPVFEGIFEVVHGSLMGSEQQHVRYKLRTDNGTLLNAVHFNGAALRQPEGSDVITAYEMTVNRFQGRESIQLLIRHIEPARASSS